MPNCPDCSACITGLPHRCKFFSDTSRPQLKRVPPRSRRDAEILQDDRAADHSPTLLRPPMAYDPPTPRPLPGLPWAPLSRREPLGTPPYSLHAAPTRHPTAATRNSMRSYNRLRGRGPDTQPSPAPPLRANTRPPAALTPVANYNFESDWREDTSDNTEHHTSANKRRRLALPRLRTQFSGRDVRGHIPYVEVRGHDYMDNSIRSEKPARKSVFREELQTVAGSEYDGDDEGSRCVRPRDG